MTDESHPSLSGIAAWDNKPNTGGMKWSRMEDGSWWGTSSPVTHTPNTTITYASASVDGTVKLRLADGEIDKIAERVTDILFKKIKRKFLRPIKKSFGFSKKEVTK